MFTVTRDMLTLLGACLALLLVFSLEHAYRADAVRTQAQYLRSPSALSLETANPPWKAASPHHFY